MSEHTEGPWKIVSKGWNGYEMDCGFNPTNDEQAANARLMMTSPDFYEGCKDLPQITDGESTADYDKRVLTWFWCNAGKIHSAVLKAEGKQ